MHGIVKLGALGLVALSLGGVAAAAEPATNTAARNQDPNQVICRRDAEIGTLVRRQRMCKTRAEWARDAARTRQEWEELQGIRGSTSGH